LVHARSYAVLLARPSSPSSVPLGPLRMVASTSSSVVLGPPTAVKYRGPGVASLTTTWPRLPFTLAALLALVSTVPLTKFRKHVPPTSGVPQPGERVREKVS